MSGRPSQVVVGSFAGEAELVEAAWQARDEGWTVRDAHTPYPVHGLDEALGIRPSRLGWVALAGGAAGLAGAVALQVWTSAVDWPLNVGGKPASSALAFLPVSFELTVLCAALTAVLAFLWRSRLRPAAPVRPSAAGATEDAFLLVLERREGQPTEPICELLRRAGASAVRVEALALLLLLPFAAACRRDPGSHGYEYMPDMAHAISYDAYAPNPVTRDGKTLQAPVPGTVARGRLPFRYGAAPEEAERAGRELANPIPASPEVLLRGQHLYETFCLVCHGAAGLGDGPLVEKYPTPPSYATARVQALPAGRLYHVITRGTGLMPGYATQIAADDRWKLVRYVQVLRARAAAAAREGP